MNTRETPIPQALLYAGWCYKDTVTIHVAGGRGNARRNSVSRCVWAPVVVWRVHVRGGARLKDEGYVGGGVVCVHISQLQVQVCVGLQTAYLKCASGRGGGGPTCTPAKARTFLT